MGTCQIRFCPSLHKTFSRAEASLHLKGDCWCKCSVYLRWEERCANHWNARHCPFRQPRLSGRNNSSSSSSVHVPLWDNSQGKVQSKIETWPFGQKVCRLLQAGVGSSAAGSLIISSGSACCSWDFTPLTVWHPCFIKKKTNNHNNKPNVSSPLRLFKSCLLECFLKRSRASGDRHVRISELDRPQA